MCVKLIQWWTLVITDVPPYGVVLGVPGRVMMILPHAQPAAESAATETPLPVESPE